MYSDVCVSVSVPKVRVGRAAGGVWHLPEPVQQEQRQDGAALTRGAPAPAAGRQEAPPALPERLAPPAGWTRTPGLLPCTPRMGGAPEAAGPTELFLKEEENMEDS